jgi:hypothetical protein
VKQVARVEEELVEAKAIHERSEEEARGAGGKLRAERSAREEPYTLHPKPRTLNPTPNFKPHTEPQTLNSQP